MKTVALSLLVGKAAELLGFTKGFLNIAESQLQTGVSDVVNYMTGMNLIPRPIV
jgi:hypothetical protein